MRTPQTRRQSLDAKAERVRQMFAQSAFVEAFETTRAEIIAEIERTTLDGAIDKQRKVLELVRQLQALTAIKRTALRPVAQQHMAANKADKHKA